MRILSALIVVVFCFVPVISGSETAEAAVHVASPDSSSQHEDRQRHVVADEAASGESDVDDSPIDVWAILARIAVVIPFLTFMSVVFNPVTTFRLVVDGLSEMRIWFQRDPSLKGAVGVAFILTVVPLAALPACFLGLELGGPGSPTFFGELLILIPWIVLVLMDGFIVAMGILDHQTKKLVEKH